MPPSCSVASGRVVTAGFVGRNGERLWRLRAGPSFELRCLLGSASRLERAAGQHDRSLQPSPRRIDQACVLSVVAFGCWLWAPCSSSSGYIDRALGARTTRSPRGAAHLRSALPPFIDKLSRSVGALQTRDDGLAVGAGGQWLAISRESGDAPKTGELRFRYGDVISSGVMLEVVLQCRRGLDSQKNTRSAVRRLLCYSMESSTSRGFQSRRPTRRLCAEVLGADVVTARHHGQDRKESAPLGSPGQGWVAVTVEQP